MFKCEDDLLALTLDTRCRAAELLAGNELEISVFGALAPEVRALECNTLVLIVIAFDEEIFCGAPIVAVLVAPLVVGSLIDGPPAIAFVIEEEEPLVIVDPVEAEEPSAVPVSARWALSLTTYQTPPASRTSVNSKNTLIHEERMELSHPAANLSRRSSCAAR